MKLNELPVNAIYAVALSYYLICIAGIYCTVRAFGIPEKRLNAALSLLFTLPGLAFSSILAQYLNLTRKNRTIPDLTTDLLRLPLPYFLILAAVCSAAIAVIYARVRRSMRETISAQSVCEGLDQLSDGICYSMPDGFPQLVNNKMQQISAAAFGTGVFDTLALNRRLALHDLQPGCAVDERDGNLFLLLPDGTAWLLRQQQIQGEKRSLTETVALDVTQRYKDLIELEQRNTRLAEVNRQLKERLNDIDRAVREKEILAAKVRLHADLGQSLLAIREYLSCGEGSREEVLGQIADTVAMLQSSVPNEQNEDKMQALFAAAQSVGVEIRIRGEIPPSYAELLATAIHESLTNTVKHAEGHLLEVGVAESDDVYTVTLTNDGAPPAGPVQETGGLADLRLLTQAVGGEMRIESEPAFRLLLRLPKGNEPYAAGNNEKRGEKL